MYKALLSHTVVVHIFNVVLLFLQLPFSYYLMLKRLMKRLMKQVYYSF